MSTGFVYLVGAGPWDPGLLTLRGRDLLARADVVVHDYLANPAHLQHVGPETECLALPGGPARPSQPEIGALLVERARAGQVVVRLKGGDPFVFGRGGEEAEVLVEAGVPFEVVPGVTSAVAAAAFAGIPVTHRAFGPTVAFATGHQQAEAHAVDWSALARMSTVVLYMARRRLAEVAAALMGAGRAAETPVALVRWATRPSQSTLVTTLGECAAAADAAGVKAPISVIVGEVVSLRERIAWYEQRPLFGLSVVVTRSRAQQGEMVARLEELGADTLVLPTIEFRPTPSARVEAAIEALSTYDLVIFTSAKGVDHFLDRIYALGRDPRAFGSARIACVGPATARCLRERGLVADLVPERFVAEGLLEALPGQRVGGQRVLIPRARVARETLPDALRARGAKVEVLPVYETVPASLDAKLRDRVAAGGVDLLSFTASSTVTHFCALFSEPELELLRARAKAVCIGPVTAERAAEAGFEVAVVAERYTVKGLIEAVVRWRGTARGDFDLV